MKPAKKPRGRPSTGGRQETHLIRIEKSVYEEARAQADRHYRSVKRHIEKLIDDERKRNAGS